MVSKGDWKFKKWELQGEFLERECGPYGIWQKM
jgi:hypothetical protein